ncbi:MAG: DNA-processing protein DprA [Clostridiales bacterium]|jgi:DNA processing protein|nr:DNA-processing protein DprA [Clostridiales bacterium]
MTRRDAFILWLASLELHNPWEHLARHGCAEDAFRNANDAKIASRANMGYLEKLVNSTRDALKDGARFVTYKNADYPPRLANIPDAPLAIFVKGQLPNPETPAVAIIGTRDNTHYGGRVAETLATELCAAGVAIISGMARGLDARAHEAALAAGGQTAAVLPCGIDICYPPSNRRLYGQIAEEGCLLTEFLPGFMPQRWSFPARNRIIAGMADILAVVEAGTKSGTLTTADHALAQGKDVFAVPGKITDKKSSGTNELIKQGAHILTSAADLLLALKINHSAPPQQPPQKIPLASDETLVYDCLNYDPCSVDYIVYKTGLNIAVVNTILLNMELAGHIKRLPGQKYIKS